MSCRVGIGGTAGGWGVDHDVHRSGRCDCGTGVGISWAGCEVGAGGPLGLGFVRNEAPDATVPLGCHVRRGGVLVVVIVVGGIGHVGVSAGSSIGVVFVMDGLRNVAGVGRFGGGHRHLLRRRWCLRRVQKIEYLGQFWMKLHRSWCYGPLGWGWRGRRWLYWLWKVQEGLLGCHHRRYRPWSDAFRSFSFSTREST